MTSVYSDLNNNTSQKIESCVTIYTYAQGDPFNVSYSLFQNTKTFLKIFYFLHNFNFSKQVFRKKSNFFKQFFFTFLNNKIHI